MVVLILLLRLRVVLVRNGLTVSIGIANLDSVPVWIDRSSRAVANVAVEIQLLRVVSAPTPALASRSRRAQAKPTASIGSVIRHSALSCNRVNQYRGVRSSNSNPDASRYRVTRSAGAASAARARVASRGTISKSRSYSWA